MLSPSITLAGGARSVARGLLRPPPSQLPPLQSVKLLDQVRERIRYLHYSRRTEEAYVHWCRAFIRFHGIRHPAEMGGPEVEAYLSWLSNEREVAVSTHRQGLSALLFLYGKVLGLSLPWLTDIGRLQLKYLDFDHGAVIVREGKGGKDRVVMLLQSLAQGLRWQLKAARSMWMQD